VASWNRFTLVGTPGEANLVSQVNGVWSSQDSEPYLRVLILDPKTGTQLWGIPEAIAYATSSKGKSSNYAGAVQRLLADVNAFTTATGATAAAPTK
jgi:hypothetical protein